MPCVLQTKKRYVGYMYETLEQKDPVFDAKGIETVRRDTCPAVAKVWNNRQYLLCHPITQDSAGVGVILSSKQSVILFF